MSDGQLDIGAVGEQVAKALAYSKTRNGAAFVATGLVYPNGASVVVRIEVLASGFLVSDDGYGAFIAETMRAENSYRRIASDLAKRAGLTFEDGTVCLRGAARQSLPVVAAAIANVSARAADRTAHALEQQRARLTRDLFESRLQAAFGSKVELNVVQRGLTNREWEFDARVAGDDGVPTLFTLVAPAFSAIAAANMKVQDVRGIADPPHVTIVLADYERTEPELRLILASAADKVIAANDDVERYQLPA